MNQQKAYVVTGIIQKSGGYMAVQFVAWANSHHHAITMAEEYYETERGYRLCGTWVANTLQRINEFAENLRYKSQQSESL